MPAPLPGRFYPVVDTAERVALMARAGARLVQLRAKDLPPATLEREIRDAADACRRHGTRLILNDHWRLAIALGLDHVHLGQEDLDVADRGAIAAAGIRLGVSTHSEAELDRALATSPDYVALGPIWPTRLKRMPWAPQGPGRLRDWKARLGGIPLVAIGGITLDRAPSCVAHGADAVAVVSDVLSDADPSARARAWMTALGEEPAGSLTG